MEIVSKSGEYGVMCLLPMKYCAMDNIHICADSRFNSHRTTRVLRAFSPSVLPWTRFYHHSLHLPYWRHVPSSEIYFGSIIVLHHFHSASEGGMLAILVERWKLRAQCVGRRLVHIQGERVCANVDEELIHQIEADWSTQLAIIFQVESTATGCDNVTCSI